MSAPIKPAWFLLRFAGWALLGEALFFLVLADGPVYRSYLAAHAWVVSGLLNAVGFDVGVQGATLILGGSAFEVARGCDVTRPIGLLAAAVLAFPATPRSKALAIGKGVLLLLGVNLIRIISLIFVNRGWPELFDSVHLAFWPLLLILLMLWFWTAWAKRQLGPEPAGPLTPPSEAPVPPQ